METRGEFIDYLRYEFTGIDVRVIIPTDIEGMILFCELKAHELGFDPSTITSMFDTMHKPPPKSGSNTYTWPTHYVR